MGEVIHVDFTKNLKRIGSCDRIVDEILEESVVKYKGDVDSLKLFADYLDMLGVADDDIVDTVETIINPILLPYRDEVVQTFVKEFTNYKQMC